MSIPYIIITQKAPPGSGREGELISCARTVTRNKTGTQKLAEKISMISTVSVADVVAVLYALQEVSPAELANGNSVELTGLGTFRISANTGALESPEQVTPLDFRPPRIIYRPCEVFREMLKNLRFTRKR